MTTATGAINGNHGVWNGTVTAKIPTSTNPTIPTAVDSVTAPCLSTRYAAAERPDSAVNNAGWSETTMAVPVASTAAVAAAGRYSPPINAIAARISAPPAIRLSTLNATAPIINDPKAVETATRAGHLIIDAADGWVVP